MKSNSRGFIGQLEDLILQIEKLESQISMHRRAGHSVEVKQFESMKLGFVKNLLTQLINSNLNVAEPQTFSLVYRLLESIYPESVRHSSSTPEYLAVESVLKPIFKHQGVYRSSIPTLAEPEVKYGKSSK